MSLEIGIKPDDARIQILAPSDRWYFVHKLQGGLDYPYPDQTSSRQQLDEYVSNRLGLVAAERDGLRRRLVSAGLIDYDWQPLV